MSGTEPMIYAYLAATALQLQGQQEQKRERRNILNASLADAERTQKSAVEQVTQEAEQLSPEERMRQMAEAEQQTYDRAMGDIQGAGGAAIDTAAGGGAVSADFARALGERRMSENARLSAIARELAKVRAPQEVATEAAMRRGAMAERLGSLWSSQRGRSDAARLDADGVEMPTYGQIGGLAQTAIGAYSGAGGAGAATGGGGTVTGGGGMKAPSSGTAWYGRSRAPANRDVRR